MNWLAAVLVWPVALLAYPLREPLFNGQVWPFLLAASAVAAAGNWRAALVIALCVAGDQILERTFEPPMAMQFALYSVMGFVAFGLFDKIAGITAVLISLIYLATVLGVPWRQAMIVSEYVLVAGLSLGAWLGPTGGYFRPAAVAAERLAAVAVSERRSSGVLVRLGLAAPRDPAAAQTLGKTDCEKVTRRGERRNL